LAQNENHSKFSNKTIAEQEKHLTVEYYLTGFERESLSSFIIGLYEDDYISDENKIKVTNDFILRYLMDDKYKKSVQEHYIVFIYQECVEFFQEYVEFFQEYVEFFQEYVEFFQEYVEFFQEYVELLKLLDSLDRRNSRLFVYEMYNLALGLSEINDGFKNFIDKWDINDLHKPDVFI
jgi:hypothetical protein